MQKTESKIKKTAELEDICRQLRKEGRAIVTCNGCFDIIHAGHVRFFHEAKNQGDVLIVAINSDASVRRIKGSARPINCQEDRCRVVAALGCVDYVTVFDEDDPREILSVIRPAVHANGEEYGEECIEAEVVKKNGGRIHLIRKIGGLSTSGLLKMLSADAAKSQAGGGNKHCCNDN
ncbi:MAG: adenylyltransferase/cytidyltransferase family protein [archaeon]